MDQGKVHITLVILQPRMGDDDLFSAILLQRTSAQNLVRLPFLRFDQNSFHAQQQQITANKTVLAKAMSVASKFYGDGRCGSQPKTTLEIPGLEDDIILPTGLVLTWNQPDRYEIIEVKRSITIDGQVGLLSDYYLVYLLDASDDAEFIADWKPRAMINMRHFVDDGQPDHGCFWAKLQSGIHVNGGFSLMGPTKHFFKHHMDELLSARATLMRNMALRHAPLVPVVVDPLHLQQV
jgi:hypothetical protein